MTAANGGKLPRVLWDAVFELAQTESRSFVARDFHTTVSRVNTIIREVRNQRAADTKSTSAVPAASSPAPARTLALTASIAMAYVSNHTVPLADLARLITIVRVALASVTATEQPRPAVPITQSITLDYLVCLEDGKKLKMLKRHLRTRFNLSPDEYRSRWGLPATYPMVAPKLATLRSQSGIASEYLRGSRRRSRAGRPTQRLRRPS